MVVVYNDIAKTNVRIAWTVYRLKAKHKYDLTKINELIYCHNTFNIDKNLWK